MKLYLAILLILSFVVLLHILKNNKQKFTNFIKNSDIIDNVNLHDSIVYIGNNPTDDCIKRSTSTECLEDDKCRVRERLNPSNPQEVIKDCISKNDINVQDDLIVNNHIYIGTGMNRRKIDINTLRRIKNMPVHFNKTQNINESKETICLTNGSIDLPRCVQDNSGNFYIKLRGKDESSDHGYDNNKDCKYIDISNTLDITNASKLGYEQQYVNIGTKTNQNPEYKEIQLGAGTWFIESHPQAYKGTIDNPEIWTGPSAPEFTVTLGNRENIHIISPSEAGGYGGSCTCPDGQVYQVGDRYNSCGSLACEGGVSGNCNSYNGEWSNKKVTCAGGPIQNRTNLLKVTRTGNNKTWSRDLILRVFKANNSNYVDPDDINVSNKSFKSLNYCNNYLKNNYNEIKGANTSQNNSCGSNSTVTKTDTNYSCIQKHHIEMLNGKRPISLRSFASILPFTFFARRFNEPPYFSRGIDDNPDFDVMSPTKKGPMSVNIAKKYNLIAFSDSNYRGTKRIYRYPGVKDVSREMPNGIRSYKVEHDDASKDKLKHICLTRADQFESADSWKANPSKKSIYIPQPCSYDNPYQMFYMDFDKNNVTHDGHRHPHFHKNHMT